MYSIQLLRRRDQKEKEVRASKSGVKVYDTQKVKARKAYEKTLASYLKWLSDQKILPSEKFKEDFIAHFTK